MDFDVHQKLLVSIFLLVFVSTTDWGGVLAKPPFPPTSSILLHTSHEHAVFNADKQWLLTWGGKEIQVWDLESKTQLIQLEHEDVVWGAVFYQSNKHLVSWSADNTIRLWDLENGKELHRLSVPHLEKQWIVNASGTHLYFIQSNTLELIGVNPGRGIQWRRLRHQHEVAGAAFHPHGDSIVTWDDKQIVRFWDLQTGRVTSYFSVPDYFEGLKFADSGTKILLWDGISIWANWFGVGGLRKPIMSFWFPEVEGTFDAEEKFVYAWDEQGAFLKFGPAHDKSEDELGTLNLKNTIPRSQINSTKSKILAWNQEEGYIVVWALNDQAILFEKQDYSFQQVWFNEPKDQVLAWNNGTLENLTHFAPPQYVQLSHEQPVEGVIPNKTGDRILSWENDAFLHTDLNGPSIRYETPENKTIYGVEVNQADDQVLVRLPGLFYLWNLDTGKTILQIPNRQYQIEGETLKDWKTEIVAWEGRVIRLWDRKEGRLLTSFQHDQLVDGAKLSESKSRLLAWGEKTVMVWEVASGEELFKYEFDEVVHGTAFNRAGTHVLMWVNIEFVRYWEIENKQEVFRFEWNNVRKAMFSRDDSLIFLTDWYGNLNVINTTNGDMLWSEFAPFVVATLNPNETYTAASIPYNGFQVEFRDLKTGELKISYQEDFHLRWETLSSDRHWLVGGGEDGKIRLWHLNSGKMWIVFDLENHPDLKWHRSEDGFRASFNTNNTKMAIWDSLGRVFIRDLPLP